VKRPPADQAEVRARKVLGALNRLERAERARRQSIGLVWILAVLLVLAIVFVLAAGRERFALLWQHLLRPDSIPQ